MSNADPKAAVSLLRRSLRTAGRAVLTLGIFAMAAGAVVAGRGVLEGQAAAVPAPAPAPVTPVAVDRLTLVDHHAVTRRFSGQFEAAQETALAFERAGTLAELRVREGDAVEAGSVIATLDTARLEAERARLEASRAGMVAQVELARRTNDRQAELRTRGFATDQTVDDTSLTLARLRAAIAEIDAGLDAVSVDLAKSTITAPFAGTIATRVLDVGAVVAPGTAVATVQQDAPPRFRVGLDPALAATLAVGDAARIMVDGAVVPARLSRLSPALDATTRSRAAFFNVLGGATPPDRATGEIALRQRVDTPGAWVPLAALQPGVRGTWTLLVVDDGIVGIEAAEVLYVDGARAFVRGTFADGQAFIPGGGHRVVPGQAVTPEAAQDRGAVAWAR